MGLAVAVAGASGYAGGELLRLIGGHPDLELGLAAAAGNAGAPVTAVHPHLTGLGDRTFEALDPARLAAADLVFLALPHEESAAVAAALPPQVPVVDLSASFRLARAARIGVSRSQRSSVDAPSGVRMSRLACSRSAASKMRGS